MKPFQNKKKKLIVSYKNLSDELVELFKETYPEGYKNYLQKTIKPNGEPIFVVPLETEDTSYMIKFEVKIDTAISDDDFDKDLDFGDDGGDDGEFAPLSEAIEKEENAPHHTERVLKYGDYEDVIQNSKHKVNHELEITGEELEAAFSDDLEEEDEYKDNYEDEDEPDEDADEEFEPTEEDLLDIENEYLSAKTEEKTSSRKKAEKAPAKPRATKATKEVKAPKGEKTTKTSKTTKKAK